MRRFILAFAAATVALGVTAASAAEIGQRQRPAYKAPPAPIAAAYNWSGFYVGGHVGGAWGSEDASSALTGLTGSTDPDGFLGGAQVGFNWQTGAFVFGIEGDWSWANADGATAIPFIVATEHNWYATATARVGYAVDNWLWYVKGGAAWLDADYTIAGLTFSENRTGWTVGTGLEWAFGPNWSAKIEYNYMDFGKDTIGTVLPVEFDTQVHVVKAGINYRFDWGKGPVIARY